MKNAREDKAIKKAVETLPQHSPSAELWDDIASALDKEAKPLPKSQNNWLRYAAVVALVVSAGLVWYSTSFKGSDISFGEELSQLTNEVRTVVPVTTEFEVFLKSECTEYRDVCEMPEFKTLISQLTDVETEVTDIAFMIETTGYDEFLYKAKTKADQETVRIKKELVKLLRG